MRISGGVGAGNVLSFPPGFCVARRVKPPTLLAFVSVRSVGSVRLKHPAACQAIPGLILSHGGHRAGAGPPFPQRPPGACLDVSRRQSGYYCVCEMVT